jgi:hypothetical protein
VFQPVLNVEASLRTPITFAGPDQLTAITGSILDADKGSIFNAV